MSTPPSTSPETAPYHLMGGKGVRFRLLPSDLPDPESLTSLVAVDCETTGLFVDDGATIAVVSVAYRDRNEVLHTHAWPFDQGRWADKGFAPTYYKNGKPKVDVGPEWDADYNLGESHWRDLLAWLRAAGAGRGLTGQNLRFDLHHLLNGTRHWRGTDLEPYAVWDTMLASKNLDPTFPTGLKPTAARIWGEDEVAEADAVKEALAVVKKRFGLKKDDGPRYDLIPWSVNGPYAAQDTALTLRLTEHQCNRLDEGEGNWTEIQEDIDLMRVLFRIERRRFGPYDVATSAAWADRIAARVEDLERQFPFTPTGPQAAAYFFDVVGARPWGPGEERREVTVGGKVLKQGSLSADIAADMARDGVEWAGEYAEYARLKIANQMFYRKYADLADPSTRRIMTSFRQALVKSGRMSVERWQAQALPKKVGLTLLGEKVPEPRDLFLTPEGKTRYNLDLSQAELRIAAKLADCKSMLDLLNSGGDFHSNTTRAIFKIDPSDPEWKAKRDLAKRANFGGIFNIGPVSYRNNLWTNGRVRISPAESEEIIEGFRSTYPEFKQMYYEWMEYADIHGRVPLASGRMSWFGPRDYPSSAWNRRVQSSLAEFVKNWLILVENITSHEEALVLTVHDSAVLELPTDVGPDLCAEIKRQTEDLWFETFDLPGVLDVGLWRE